MLGAARPLHDPTQTEVQPRRVFYSKMALPKAQRHTFTPSEVEFIAETLETVKINPTHRLAATRTLAVRMTSLITVERSSNTVQGLIGPLQPRVQAEVPLWLACSLKKMRRCEIYAPDWLTIGARARDDLGCSFDASGTANLEAQLKQETTNPAFASLPLRYMETAHVLLDWCVLATFSSMQGDEPTDDPHSASDDIRDADKLRNLLKDLREARQAKSRLTAELLEGEFSVHLAVTGISVMEFNELRPFFSLATKRLIALDPAEEERAEQDERYGSMAEKDREREAYGYEDTTRSESGWGMDD